MVTDVQECKIGAVEAIRTRVSDLEEEYYYVRALATQAISIDSTLPNTVGDCVRGKHDFAILKTCIDSLEDAFTPAPSEANEEVPDGKKSHVGPTSRTSTQDPSRLVEPVQAFLEMLDGQVKAMTDDLGTLSTKLQSWEQAYEMFEG